MIQKRPLRRVVLLLAALLPLAAVGCATGNTGLSTADLDQLAAERGVSPRNVELPFQVSDEMRAWLADEVGDNGTKQLLETILKDEEMHIDWLEEQLDQIEQMGIQIYLSTQRDGAGGGTE